MAKATTTVVKPVPARGYGKIVFLTLVAIVIGCALMGYEIFIEQGGTPTKVPAAKINMLPPAERGPAPAPAPAPGPNQPGGNQ